VVAGLMVMVWLAEPLPGRTKLPKGGEATGLIAVVSQTEPSSRGGMRGASATTAPGGKAAAPSEATMDLLRDIVVLPARGTPGRVARGGGDVQFGSRARRLTAGYGSAM